MRRPNLVKFAFLRFALAIAALFATMPNASALVILANPIAPGSTIPGTFGRLAETKPVAAVGAGTLVEIFNAAATIWEVAVPQPHTVAINFAWSSGGILAGPAAGVTNRISPTEFSIRFDTGLGDPGCGGVSCADYRTSLVDASRRSSWRRRRG